MLEAQVPPRTLEDPSKARCLVPPRLGSFSLIKAEDGNTKQSVGKHSNTKTSKAKHSTPKQNKAEHRKAKQSILHQHTTTSNDRKQREAKQTKKHNSKRNKTKQSVATQRSEI